MLYRCFSFLRAGLFWKVAAGVVFLCVLAGGLSGLVFAAGAEAPSAPALISDLEDAGAAEMTLGECNAFVQKIFRANSAKALWKRHANVSATFRLFETESQMWKEYSCFYADPML